MLMLQASERDVAFSMLRLWGRDADALAAHYASLHEIDRNLRQAARWMSVHLQIQHIRDGEPPVRAG